MNILLATTNPHKADEIRAILGRNRVSLTTLDDLGRPIDEPVEDRDTFEGNATLKARYYADQTGWACMADDSGLEVDALGGAPGVISARYAGVQGPRSEADPANNAKLMHELGDTPADQRTARFVCVIAVCRPGEDEPAALVRGTMEGRIITPDEAEDAEHIERGRGHNGFGYDPLFVVHAQGGKTSAELAPDHKNMLSHRAAAVARLAETLETKGLV